MLLISLLEELNHHRGSKKKVQLYALPQKNKCTHGVSQEDYNALCDENEILIEALMEFGYTQEETKQLIKIKRGKE